MTPDALLVQAGFSRLKETVIAGSGMAYYADKDRDFAEHAAARMSELGIADADAYAARLAQPDEFAALARLLTIGETFFLRHPLQFAALCAQVVPDLIVRNRERRRLRLWSAGCSTGEEVWTLAIVLAQEFSSQLAGWDVEIAGTDLNAGSLELARLGCYREWSFRGTEPAWREANFRRRGEQWEVQPALRRGVRFAVHNLVAQPFAPPFSDGAAPDLILCRNVLIYFSRDSISSLVDDFRGCLAPGGWLVVGPAENDPELFRAFRRIACPEATLYQQGGAAVETPAVAPMLPMPPPAAPPLAPSVEPPTASAETSRPRRAAAAAAMLRSYADAGDWRSAIALCRRQLEHDHADAQWQFRLGVMLVEQGEELEAERSLRRSLYLDRDFALAHYQLGRLLAGQGKVEAAARCWRNAAQSLAGLADDTVLTAGDGISAGELKGLLLILQSARVIAKDER